MSSDKASSGGEIEKTETPANCVRAIACNHNGNSYISPGALAHVVNPNWGFAEERIEVLIRSRSGRWVRKWESLHHLRSFRCRNVSREFSHAGLLKDFNAEDERAFFRRLEHPTNHPDTPPTLTESSELKPPDV